MTPTSGDAPYVFTAQFADRFGLDHGFYALEFYGSTAVGACPAAGTSGNQRPDIALAILADGTYTQEVNSIPLGSCRTSTLVIREVATGAIVSQESVTIDNVE